MRRYTSRLARRALLDSQFHPDEKEAAARSIVNGSNVAL